ncbi:5-(carboxyamino)imidazole ribonucleotide mutase [ANME-1 cluster archaeon ex4572_4]|nr:MAG: 5-(carboxyamino)imidazole ribonucleotide mutase [ANME-1 cluster archaeon ex4572_4]
MQKVAIILGSESDRAVAEKAVKVLEERKVAYEVRVISAHRNPKALDKYLEEKEKEEEKEEKDGSVAVFITIAGLSAALPGVVASKTEKPVVGVPVSGKSLGGLDALLSMVQMPSGVPVAVVGIDSGANAALLAVRILNLSQRRK